MTIKAIKNHIIFKFVDKTNAKGQFEREQTEGGIVLQSSFDESAKEPRWVEVVAVGPDCTKVKVGERALVPALRWTEGANLNGSRFWKTNEVEVVAVLRDDLKFPIQPINKWVIFQRAEKDIKSSAAGLIVVRGVGNTPTGYTLAIGPDCDSVLTKAKIYFSDQNFFNDFYHTSQKLSFIKEDDVIAYEPFN